MPQPTDRVFHVLPFEYGRIDHGDGTQTKIRYFDIRFDIPKIGSICAMLRLGAYVNEAGEPVVLLRSFSVGFFRRNHKLWRHFDMKGLGQ